MAEPIMVATPTAVYLTQAPGSRIYVAGNLGKDDTNVQHRFINFAPTGAVQAHPHALREVYQVEGFALASNPALVAELDRLVEMGHVPFIRHPNPEICVGTEVEPGVGTGDDC